MTPADVALQRGHTDLAAWLDRAASDAGGGDSHPTSSFQTGQGPIAHAQRRGRDHRRSEAAQPNTQRSEENAARMEELRRAHERHLEKERAADKEKEERRKARAKDERERRDRAAAERARAGSSNHSNRSAPAPWPQGMPITGAADAAAEARREADKSASLEQAAEHSTHLRQRERARIEEALRRMETLRLAELIQRGD
jgi:hypothetical protein